MTNEQIKTLLASGTLIENVRLRPDQDMEVSVGRNMVTGFVMTFDAALDLWAIESLTGAITQVAAADIMSLRFSSYEKVKRVA